METQTRIIIANHTELRSNHGPIFVPAQIRARGRLVRPLHAYVLQRITLQNP